MNPFFCWPTKRWAFEDTLKRGSAFGLIGSYFGGIYEWSDDAGSGGYRGIVRRTHYMVCTADYFAFRIRQNGKPILLDEKAENYVCALDLRSGLLSRSYTTPLPEGGQISIRMERLLGMADAHMVAQRVILTADRSTWLSLDMLIDGNVQHRMIGKCLWRQVQHETSEGHCGLRLETATTDQTVEYLFFGRRRFSL